MGLLDLLVPLRCGGCGDLGPSPCHRCIAAMVPAPASRPPAGLDLCRAAIEYEGPARPLVAGLKYRNGRAALAWMVSALTALAPGVTADVVTWIPAAPAHRRTRGFDHGRLLASGLAQNLHLPLRPLLSRAAGPAQTGRSLASRRDQGPRLRCTPLPLGLRVLLVDDVWTTGASLEAAAAALRGAGGGWIGALTVARTPLKATPLHTEANADGNGEPPSTLPEPSGHVRGARAGAGRPTPPG